ncbi:MAG TPA: hypothetical protein VIH71_04675 [Solirubrobacteraceae bacterium]
MAVSIAREPTDESRAWDARAELDIGVLIHSHLVTHPAPAASEVAAAMQRRADGLQDAGRAKLRRFGLRVIAAVDNEQGGDD